MDNYLYIYIYVCMYIFVSVYELFVQVLRVARTNSKEGSWAEHSEESSSKFSFGQYRRLSVRMGS